MMIGAQGTMYNALGWSVIQYGFSNYQWKTIRTAQNRWPTEYNAVYYFRMYDTKVLYPVAYPSP